MSCYVLGFFDEPAGLDNDLVTSSTTAHEEIRQISIDADACVGGRPLSVSILDSPYFIGSVVLLTLSFATSIITGAVFPALARVVRLGARLDMGSLVRGCPGSRLLHRIRRACVPVVRRRRQFGPETRSEWSDRYNNMLLEIPKHTHLTAGGRTHQGAAGDGVPLDVDPIRCMRGLQLCQYLR